MTSFKHQSEEVALPNLKNKMLHISIPHLLKLSEYNWSYGKKCYPYPPILSCFWPSNDLQMSFVNDQSGRVPLPNLKNKKLHILIPHLLQLSVYNQSFGEKCYPYPPILSPELTRYWMCIVIFQPLSRPSIVISLSLEF